MLFWSIGIFLFLIALLFVISISFLTPYLIRVLLGLCGAVLGLYLGYIWWKNGREQRLLKSYRGVEKISNLPENTPVYLQGKVKTDKSLAAPVSGKAAVYFKVKVDYGENPVASGPRSIRNVLYLNAMADLKAQLEKEEKTGFYLVDSSGKTYVNPGKLIVKFSLENQAQFHQESKPVESKGYRFLEVEEGIYDGALVTVFGVKNSDGNLFEGNYPMVLSPMSRDQLLSSDASRGTISFFISLSSMLAGFYLIISTFFWK